MLVPPTAPQQPSQPETQRPPIRPTTAPTSPTYPPRPPSVPTYPAYPTEQGTHIGVQPPTQPQPTGPAQPEPEHTGPGPQQPGSGAVQPGVGPQQPGSGVVQPGSGPQQPSFGGQYPGYFAYPQFLIIPYPIALSGVPGGCPCYYMESQNNGTSSPHGTQPPPTHPQTPPGQQFQGAGIPAGFLASPLLFYPACGTNGQQVQQQVQQMFTGAVPVPYACDACAKQQEAQQQAQKQPRRRVNRRRRISNVGSK